MGAAEKPVRITRVTTRYVPVEDRLRLEAELEDGARLGFWLTQRLAREVVKTLVAHVERQGLERRVVPPEARDEVQRQLHAAARARRGRTPPVAEAPESVLLDRVRIRATDRQVQLFLPLPEGRVGALAMGPDHARQWLDILFQQYRAAGWPLDVWPAWIRSEKSSARSAAGERLH